MKIPLGRQLAPLSKSNTAGFPPVSEQILLSDEHPRKPWLVLGVKLYEKYET